MTIELVRSALLWCTVMNFGVLGLWGLLFLLPHEWMYQVAGRVSRLSPEQLDTISVAGMLLYKVGILFFNLVRTLPCVLSAEGSVTNRKQIRFDCVSDVESELVGIVQRAD